MKMKLRYDKSGPQGAAHGKNAFTFAEVLIAVGILGFVSTSLLIGFKAGFCMIQSTRENLRATQIMVQKMEAVRLFTWSQVGNTTNYLKSNFTEVYDPLGATNNSSGPKYTGFVTASVPAVGDLPEAYRTNMRTVTVNIYWTNSNRTVTHHRVMRTRVARNGMQNYIWGNL